MPNTANQVNNRAVNHGHVGEMRHFFLTSPGLSQTEALAEPHLSAVALQVADVLECDGRVDLDDVAVHGREQVAAVAEGALGARADGELLDGAHVAHQNHHVAQLVRKSRQHAVT